MSKSDRFLRFRERGCVACYLNGTDGVPFDVHHLLSGGRRRGDEFTIPLCPWHHRGVKSEAISTKEMTEVYGPSLANGSRKFRERYGTDEELLAYTNRLIR